MPYPKALSIFSILMASVFFSFNPEEKIVSTLKKYVEEYPQEKIYVHCDRPYYAVGEIIWFKVYLTAGSYHQPSPISYTVHVELINSKREIVQEVKLRSENGFAHGYFSLPDSLRGSNCQLRAYTPWMQNFNSDYFFYKEIKIYNSDVISKNSVQDQDIDVQFFPEGGALVNGLMAKVAFKAIGKDGLGKKVTLKVVDNENKEVAQAESNQFGMGFVTFLPEEGKKYTGIMTDGKKYEMAEARKSGFLLAVTNKPDQSEVIVRIQSTDDAPNKQQMIVLAQCRGVVAFMAKANLSNNRLFVKIPKSRLLPGITQITLFDSRTMPVAERLVFTGQESALKLTVTPDKALYKPRERIDLTIQSSSEDGKPVSGNFSLAVVDNLQVKQHADRSTIVDQLWLSSDLKGKIENPGYYFNPENKDRHEALDLLLLTQGWRRFVWDDVLNDKWPEIKHPIDRGFKISGKLVDILSKKPIAGGKVTYLASDGGLMIAKTGEDGSFEFSDLTFSDTAEVVLQGENKRGNKTVNFEIAQEIKPVVSYVPSRGVEGEKETGQKYLAESQERRKIDSAYNFDEKTVILQGVEVRAKRIEANAEAKNVYGKGNTTIKTSEILGSQSLTHPLQLIQGRAAGVMVTGSGLSYNVLIRGVGSTSSNTPLIMVDNIAIDMNTLSTISPRDIESVEIFKGPEAAIFGAEGASGAILFFTKEGRNSPTSRLGIYNLKFSGYAAPREFYSPKYDVSKPEHSKPDKRVTIFWAPVIKTDSTGLAKISFYNNDIETSVMGVIEGISSYGTPGTNTFQYEISKP